MSNADVRYNSKDDARYNSNDDVRYNSNPHVRYNSNADVCCRCTTTKHGYQSKRTYGKVVRKQKMDSYIVG